MPNNKYSQENAAMPDSENKLNENMVQQCVSCGHFYRMSYRFCPFCGKASSLYAKAAAPKVSVQRETAPQTGEPDGERRRSSSHSEIVEHLVMTYLKKIGKADQADELFSIKIYITDIRKLVQIKLRGRENGSDAISLLRANGVISGYYRFTNWPKVSPEWGPDYNHVLAFSCEVNETIYRLEPIQGPVVCLYGCPRAAGMNFSIPEKKIEITEF